MAKPDPKKGNSEDTLTRKESIENRFDYNMERVRAVFASTAVVPKEVVGDLLRSIEAPMVGGKLLVQSDRQSKIDEE